MKSLTLGVITITGVALLLGACSNSPLTSTPSNSSASQQAGASPEALAKTNQTEASNSPNKGGQVVESGNYHLELVPEKATSSTHLDLYVQKGDTHASIPDAKVTADVQLPDGQQKTLSLSYDASGKHYAAELSGKTPGQYQVKVTAVIGKDQADGRFSFSR